MIYDHYEYPHATRREASEYFESLPSE